MIPLIQKPRTLPLKILVLAALLRRLPPNHPKYQLITDEYKRRLAEYQGEESLDYYFRSLPSKKFLVFHDLNLPDGDYNCQIDTLLLTTEFCLLIDSKYMKGKLVFDTDNQQFIQISNGDEKGFPDPIAQGERHKEYLQNLLKELGLPEVSIDYLVVISNTYASYSITGKDLVKVRPRVCKADVMLNKINQLESPHKTTFLSSKDIRKLIRNLIKMNTPPTTDILKSYGIERHELRTGVYCPSCLHLRSPVKMENGTVICVTAISKMPI